jgi:hypothetical protein
MHVSHESRANENINKIKIQLNMREREHAAIMKKKNKFNKIEREKDCEVT